MLRAAVGPRGLAFSLFLSLSMVSFGVASAQERDDEAHGLYIAGEAAYDAGHFEDALRYFQQSYALSARPDLLFNIGQAADRARMDEVALDAFRRFLEARPDIEDRPRIEARIRALEAALARGAHAPVEGEGPAAEDVHPTSGDARPAEVAVAVEPTAAAPSGGIDGGALGLTISGGVLAIVGAVLIGVGAEDTGALGNPRLGETYPEAQSRQDTGTALVGAGIAGIGVGAVLAVVGAVLFASGGGSSEHARLGASGLEVSF